MIHHRQLPLAVLLLAQLTACEEDEPETTCTISSTLSGDLDAALPGSRGVACVVPFSSGDGLDVTYTMLSAPALDIDLAISGVTKGSLGDAFPAALRITDEAETRWASPDCSVAIDTHEFIETVEFGDSYQVRGTGQCSAPLTREGAGALTLAPFEFAVVVTWQD